MQGLTDTAAFLFTLEVLDAIDINTSINTGPW